MKEKVGRFCGFLSVLFGLPSYRFAYKPMVIRNKTYGPTP